MIEKIDKDLKSAMLKRDQQTVSVLRMLKSALQNKKIDNKGELTDKDVVAVLRSEAKKRKESIEMFKKGGKTEQAESEEAELKIIEGYLPAQLSDEELAKIVEDVKNELGEDAHMGQIIKETIARTEGRADGGRISAYIRQLEG